MMTATFISPPIGGSLGHTEGCALPNAMFTIVSNSSMVTALLSLQSPTQALICSIANTPPLNTPPVSIRPRPAA